MTGPLINAVCQDFPLPDTGKCRQAIQEDNEDNMEGFDGHTGISELAAVISGRIKKEQESPLRLDFGEIQENGSLVTNTFPQAIPKGDYSVCRQLTLGRAGESLLCTATEPPRHTVILPDKMRSVCAGDRVLVAWVQNEAVVVDIIEKS